MRVLAALTVTIAACGRINIDAQNGQDAGFDVMDQEVSDAPSACDYTCTVDAIAGTTTCTGRVTVTSGPPVDEHIAVIDLTGQRELGFVAELCDPLGWTIHVGDSPTNNGGGGDGGSASNDSELQLVDTAFTVFGNDFGPGVLTSKPAFARAIGCTTVTGRLIDQEVHVDGVEPADVVSPYALRLAPAMDLEGTPDSIWYLGVNRTYGSAARTGDGLRYLELCLR